MEKYIEATILRPLGDRKIDAPLVTIDLPSFIEQIRKEKKWKDTDRNAITVFKANGLRIVLIALRKGAEMIRHTANGLISVQVLEGKMQLHTDERSFKLGTGQMLALHEGIPHSLLAKKKTIFLLTLTTSLAEDSIMEESYYNSLVF
ncbi:MAG TPA: cupin domain-containing protein [Chitinophagaceae bacterium]|nr:cupin domain-containing protein [Chitinophagaceae bacterium]